MKVVINAVSAKMGGAANYIGNLLRFLPSLAGDAQFLVYLPPETAAKRPDLPGNIRLSPTRIGHGSWWKRMWWEQVTLRRVLKQQGADVLFSTANFGMFRCPVPQLLLVRNALYFSPLYEQTFVRKHPLKTRIAFQLRRRAICRSVHHADVVMTPTQAMLDDLCRFVPVSAKKALVNPYGVAQLDARQDRAEAGAVGLGPPDGQRVRLLYVSLYSEHKNLSTLLKALPVLNRNGGRRFVLKTTANPAWEEASCTVTYRHDLDLARDPEVGQWVEFAGPLAMGQTQQLYRDADIFVFPSIVESFGFPMAEAMAYGLPIVAADTPVNREICGEGAVYFAPFNCEDLAQQVLRVAADDALSTRLAATGRCRAATNFGWDGHVKRVLQIVARIKTRRPSSSAT